MPPPRRLRQNDDRLLGGARYLELCGREDRLICAGKWGV